MSIIVSFQLIWGHPNLTPQVSNGGQTVKLDLQFDRQWCQLTPLERGPTNTSVATTQFFLSHFRLNWTVVKPIQV